jgi:hypothetical protein
MTTDTSACEEFEIAALRRARGAIDAAGAARLEAHLGTCTACRAFAETAAVTEQALRGRSRRASAGRDWVRIRAGLDARSKDLRKHVVRSLGVTWILVALAWLLEGVPFALFTGGASVVTVAVVVIFHVLPRERAARRAARSDAALLAWYRADLDREIRSLRVARPMVFVLGALWLGTCALSASQMIFAWSAGRPFDSRLQLFPPLVIAFVIAQFAYQGWVRLPRLERERKDLA